MKCPSRFLYYLCHQYMYTKLYIGGFSFIFLNEPLKKEKKKEKDSGVLNQLAKFNWLCSVGESTSNSTIKVLTPYVFQVCDIPKMIILDNAI